MKTRSLERLGALAVLSFVSSAVTLSASDWPQWRGPDGTGHAVVSSASPLWLPKDVQPKWRLPVGGGFSSPVIANGRLFYLDDQNGREMAHAVDAQTGKEIWRVEYAETCKDEWGAAPRATPLIDEERLFVQACNGEFRCLSVKDGSVLWQGRFEKDLAVKIPGRKGNACTATRQ